MGGKRALHRSSLGHVGRKSKARGEMMAWEGSELSIGPP